MPTFLTRREIAQWTRNYRHARVACLECLNRAAGIQNCLNPLDFPLARE